MRFHAIIILASLAMTGCCSTTKCATHSAAPVSAVEKPVGSVVSGAPAVGMLKTRDKAIIMRSGLNGTLYTVKAEDGRVLATDLPMDALVAQFPELAGVINEGVAWAGMDLETDATQ